MHLRKKERQTRKKATSAWYNYQLYVLHSVAHIGGWVLHLVWHSPFQKPFVETFWPSSLRVPLRKEKKISNDLAILNERNCIVTQNEAKRIKNYSNYFSVALSTSTFIFFKQRKNLRAERIYCLRRKALRLKKKIRVKYKLNMKNWSFKLIFFKYICINKICSNEILFFKITK